ncbi:LacI family DNA-binding transcriptional regulator [Breznakiella homolactica]|uniref:LacI family DNA-binding transcriptional regulator n=1 Tax=Breznakiella homolactica TaxID=2798577 RepID=A0A7T8BAE7_9SPIR|nr:LacI family DNA-binding transcriptional regulator [Breznakiella homolactica]QQO08133.1 LacI family transcriptional regulator [Breznakiella homolactica]
MGVTIKDIAQILGVSHTTVSRALLDRPDISEPMKEKVRKVARELNYQTNDLARSLVKNKSNAIGLIIPDIEDPHYASICKQLSLRLEESGYSLLICNSERDREKDRKCIEYLMRQRVAGYIIFSGNIREDIFSDFFEQHFPTVLIHTYGEPLGVDSVMGNNFLGASAAVQHLINIGYRRIAHFRGYDNGIPSQERYHAFLETLEENKILREKCPIIGNEASYEGGLWSAEQLLKLPERPEAVFTVNDAVAIGAMQYFYKAGVRVPEDIAVIGFDDVSVAKMMPVPLSTVRLSAYEIADNAWKQLREQISGTRLPGDHKNTLVEPSLVIRDTCGYKLKQSAAKRKTLENKA